MTRENGAPDNSWVEAEIEDVIRVRSALAFAIQYDPTAMEAFDRLMGVMDDYAERVEAFEDRAI